MTNTLRQDSLWGGKLSLWQPTKGYRFNIDPLILAHFLKPGDRLLELGAGCGVLSILALKQGTFLGADAVEVQEVMCQALQRNREANGLSAAMHIHHADLTNIVSILDLEGAPRQGFDAVAFNPPYFKHDASRPSKDPGRDIGRREVRATLADFVRVGAACLGKGGALYAIVPHIRLNELLQLVRTAGLTPIEVSLVHPTHNAPPLLALLHAQDVPDLQRSNVPAETPAHRLVIHADVNGAALPASGRKPYSAWLQCIIDGENGSADMQE